MREIDIFDGHIEDVQAVIHRTEPNIHPKWPQFKATIDNLAELDLRDPEQVPLAVSFAASAVNQVIKMRDCFPMNSEEWLLFNVDLYLPLEAAKSAAEWIAFDMEHDASRKGWPMDNRKAARRIR